MIGREREGQRFTGYHTAADRFDRAHHAAVAAQRVVGEPDNKAVWVGGGRGFPHGDRDRLL